MNNDVEQTDKLHIVQNMNFYFKISLETSILNTESWNDLTYNAIA